MRFIKLSTTMKQYISKITDDYYTRVDDPKLLTFTDEIFDNPTLLAHDVTRYGYMFDFTYPPLVMILMQEITTRNYIIANKHRLVDAHFDVLSSLHFGITTLFQECADRLQPEHFKEYCRNHDCTDIVRKLPFKVYSDWLHTNYNIDECIDCLADDDYNAMLFKHYGCNTTHQLYSTINSRDITELQDTAYFEGHVRYLNCSDKVIQLCKLTGRTIQVEWCEHCDATQCIPWLVDNHPLKIILELTTFDPANYRDISDVTRAITRLLTSKINFFKQETSKQPEIVDVSGDLYADYYYYKSMYELCTGL